MTALDRLSKYSMSKICDACALAGFYVPYKQRRTKAALLERISTASEEQLLSIEEAMVEPGQKRAHRGGPVRNDRLVKRLRQFDPSEHFMDLPDKDTMNKCMENYIDATSNSALSTAICVSCARRTWYKEMHHCKVGEIANLKLLVPRESHPAHELYEGRLLCPQAINRSGETHLCADCERYLKQERLPPLALANNMWLGDIPVELRVLSLPERVLIAKYLATAYIVTLMGDKRTSCRNAIQTNQQTKNHK
ncbi:hypothetical protein H0H93_016947 [Arthromyces matolae]|nr:hypothetical protein H0H93_016947 [Arthromyces matolae]